MELRDTDKAFAGSIPELYDRLLVPLIFEPYAQDIAARVAARQPRDVLEIAAGTGVATRAMAAVLPPAASLVATDLNQAMLDRAAARGCGRPVEWRQADALDLPFDDARFDVAVCQFGVMFFPAKARAFAEARRVLRPGGLLVFNVWDRIEENDFAAIVTAALAAEFPAAPPRFMARTPHGYHDTATIARDLAAGGFTAKPVFATLARESRAADARTPAVAYCQGTPLRNEIPPEALDSATRAAEAALARRFGAGPVAGRIQAHVAAVERR
jgi:ubiquinone/menaquinone biosynthesis C-methylase UbiE